MTMLEQIHNRLQSYRLREGFKSKDDFTVKNTISASSIKQWSDKSNKEVFAAAKKGTHSALEYLFYKMDGAIYGTFWNNYLGPDGGKRRYRIHQEDAWEEWLGVAWQAMTEGFADIYNTTYKKGENAYTSDEGKEHRAKGALATFDPSKQSEDTMMNVFAGRFKKILVNAAINANLAKKSAGISGTAVTGGSAVLQVHQYEPTWYEKGGESDWNPDNDDTDAHGESYEDETFDKVNTDVQSNIFLKKWKEFVQDERLQKKTKNVSVSDVFYEVIDNPNAELSGMAKKFGIAYNSVSTLLNSAQSVMQDYKIASQELMTAIKHFGNDKVASYLKGIEPSKELPKKIDKDIPKEKKVKSQPLDTDNFKESFTVAFEDEDIWTPHHHGGDPANVLLWWINDDFPEIEELESEYHLRKGDGGYWLRKAFRVLKRYGITESSIRQAVEKFGKEEVADCIGDSDSDFEFN